MGVLHGVTAMTAIESTARDRLAAAAARPVAPAYRYLVALEGYEWALRSFRDGRIDSTEAKAAWAAMAVEYRALDAAMVHAGAEMVTIGHKVILRDSRTWRLLIVEPTPAVLLADAPECATSHTPPRPLGTLGWPGDAPARAEDETCPDCGESLEECDCDLDDLGDDDDEDEDDDDEPLTAEAASLAPAVNRPRIGEPLIDDPDSWGEVPDAAAPPPGLFRPLLDAYRRDADERDRLRRNANGRHVEGEC